MKDISSKHDVIIQIDEFVREARDPVEVDLDGGRAEGGQVGLVREDVRVCHHCQSWMLFIILSN